MNILSTFAERLKELIFDAKTTPEALSAELGHSVYDIYHWMSPNNKYMPTVSNLIMLADYFCCSIDFLIGLTEDNSKPKPDYRLPKFSERFPQLVRNANTNLYRLGKVTSTSTTTYYRWINETAVPTIDSLIKVASALDVSIDFLLGREG